MVTEAQREAQSATQDTGDTGDTDVHDVHDADVVDDTAPQDTPPPAPPREPQPATVPRTLEEQRAALQSKMAELDRQAAQQGGYKEIPRHVGVLLCGCQVGMPNTAATHHHCENHNVTVRFVNVYPIDDDVREVLAHNIGNL